MTAKERDGRRGEWDRLEQEREKLFVGKTHIRWSSEYSSKIMKLSNIMNILYFHFNFDRNLEFIYQLEILPYVDTVTHFIYIYMYMSFGLQIA